jgi:hypothetical protein
LEKGDYVRIALDAPDRHMSALDKSSRGKFVPGEFGKGHDWKWTSRLYRVANRRAVNGASALKSRKVNEYQFYVYTVKRLVNPHNLSRRLNEPEFSDNVRLTGEYLQRVDAKYLQSREYLRIFPAGVDITA